MDKKEKELREQICDIGKNLFNKDFVEIGRASCRERV